MKKYLSLLAIVTLMFCVGIWQAQATASSQMRSPTLDWDSRLDELNVSYQPAADCSAGCWRLVSAQYEDQSQSGGNHNIFGRMRDENGTLLVNATWYVAWADGISPTIYTKPEPDWSDFPINACYYPDQGLAGGYRAYAGNNEAQSDKISGMGLPYCWHVNFKLIWQWEPSGESATPTPTATQTATQTALPDTTPSVTPTPNPNLIARLWLPLVLREKSTEPTPTATLTPSELSPTATATANGSSISFDGEIVQTFANCGLTQVIGVVHDINGQPLPNTRIRIIKQKEQIQYTTAGSYIRPETDNSGWNFELAFQPIAYTWRLAVVDESNLPLSSDIYVNTDSTCNEGAANVVKVRFFVTSSGTATPVSSSPTATASEIAVTPTDTTATPSATATNIPASPTPTASGMPFSGEVVETFTNCGLTQVFGIVHDTTGQPLPGTRVRLTWDNGKSYYATAGTYIRHETDASGWEFFLNSYAVGNTWRVAIVDQANNLLSEDVYVQTDSHCNSGAANAVKVYFHE